MGEKIDEILEGYFQKEYDLLEVRKKLLILSSDLNEKNEITKTDFITSVCPKCDGKGWYFVNEWIGSLQGRKDCKCKGQTDC